MIQRIYIHNFRCFENFELKLTDHSTVLIGKNGVGKSTIANVLKIYQKIGNGVNRVGDLIKKNDFPNRLTKDPLKKIDASSRPAPIMRLELEVLLEDIHYQYSILFEWPPNFRDARVAEEQLVINGTSVLNRSLAQVIMNEGNARFTVDWHLVALPIIGGGIDGIDHFRDWLSRIMILAPIPALMNGESSDPTLLIEESASNIGDWFANLVREYPKSYTEIEESMKDLMPDFLDIQTKSIGDGMTRMVIQFGEADEDALQVNFNDLSQGEKCFLIYALTSASNKRMKAFFCFWDEPDNHITLSEIGRVILGLRRSFQQRGQIIVASHNYEIIRKFPQESTLILSRKSHAEPPILRQLSELTISMPILDAILLDELMQ